MKRPAYVHLPDVTDEQLAGLVNQPVTAEGKVIGVVVEAWREDGEARAGLHLDPEADVTEVVVDVKSRPLPPGASIHSTVRVK